MKRLIGIAGQLGSGKDTAAEVLCKEFGFTRVSLADPIKQFGKQVFAFTDEQLWGPSHMRNAHDVRFSRDSNGWVMALARHNARQGDFLDEIFGHQLPWNHDLDIVESLDKWFFDLELEHPNLSPRVMLQTLGTEWGRTVNPNIWINYAIKRPAQADTVIPDVRFQNELEAIQSAGGKVLRILRPETDQNSVNTGVQFHASETSLAEWPNSAFDYVIVNDGTLAQFKKEVRRFAMEALDL